MDRLSKRERQDRILARLDTPVAVRISDLAEEFDVTTETIRRDLDELAERGLLARTYGGAAMRALTDEPGIATRAQTNVAERQRIALDAARLVKSGDVIMIDAGSTTAHLAESPGAAPDRVQGDHQFDRRGAHARPVRNGLGTLVPGRPQAHRGGRVRCRDA